MGAVLAAAGCTGPCRSCPVVDGGGDLLSLHPIAPITASPAAATQTPNVLPELRFADFMLHLSGSKSYGHRAQIGARRETTAAS
jgi:hypothetical protein